MRLARERRALQVVICTAVLVPITAGAAGVLLGPGMVESGLPPGLRDLSSHFAYLSGLLLGLGLMFLAMVPKIEACGPLFRRLAFVVVLGGMARLWTLLQQGPPDAAYLFGLVMELGVVPVLVAWQWRLALRYRRSGVSDGRTSSTVMSS
ncbi:MAG: DUF4345 domain-containing protein [Geminicoccaceae bacterium]|nr:DUF4345 domain-containing protein [Geminicoccaceae bacterium]